MTENIDELEQLLKRNLLSIENQSSLLLQQMINNLADLIDRTINLSKQQHDEIQGFQLVNANLVREVEHYKMFGANVFANRIQEIVLTHISIFLDNMLNFISEFIPIIYFFRRQIKSFIEQKINYFYNSYFNNKMFSLFNISQAYVTFRIIQFIIINFICIFFFIFSTNYFNVFNIICMRVI